jgi:uncharacterized protein (TIRG00374 family)
MIIIKIILSIFLVYIIFIQVDISAIAEKIAQMAPSWIIAVAFFFVIQVTCAAQRWRYVLAGMQQHLATRSALRLIFLGQFFNQCLPSNIGGDTLRMFYLRREGIGTGSAIRSVLLDRIAGLLILTLLCSISLPFLIKHLENQIAIMGLLAIIVVGWGGSWHPACARQSSNSQVPGSQVPWDVPQSIERCPPIDAGPYGHR